MADKNLNIKIKGDAKGGLNALDNVSGKINELNARVKKTTAPFTNFKTAAASLAGTLSFVTDTAKKVAAAISECAAAARVQIQAETQLEAAARNNPYLDGSSVKQLKEYAAQLQSVSTAGDEELIPFMAQLAAAGRTQAEIQDIMSAALDMSASGTMSLDSAVRNLNKTYSGLSGELGEANPRIKALTAEQLKGGEAVKIVAEQYKGMSAEVARTTGTSQQLKNAMGDLKEELGAPFEKALGPVRTFFTELIGGWAASAKARREALEREGRIEDGTADSSDYMESAEEAEEELGRIRERLAETRETLFQDYKSEQEYWGREVTGEADAGFQTYLSQLSGLLTKSQERQLTSVQESYRKVAVEYAAQYKKLSDLRKSYDRKSAEEETARRNEADEAAAADEIAQLKKEQDERDSLRASYDETLRQKKEEINQRRINGEEISEEAEAQEMYNTAFAAYIKMMSSKAFEGNSGNYSHEVDARAQIAQWAETGNRISLREQIQDFETELRTAADDARGIVRGQYDIVLETLDSEYQAVISNENLEQDEKRRIQAEYMSARMQVEGAQAKAEKELITQKIAELTGTERTRAEVYEEEQRRILELREETDRSEVLSAKEKTAALMDLDNAYAESRRRQIEEMRSEQAAAFAEATATAQDYIRQFAGITQSVTSLVQQSNESQTDQELAELSERYTDGIISYEEYCDKKKAINRKAAQEQYKLDMWSWTASMLTATADVAAGIAKALAQGGYPAGLINAALLGAAGAVQIATLVANKPHPPSFARGGIVPGNSYSGDRVQANVNSGEMILNAAQQKQLWNMANGARSGSSGVAVNMPVTIHNSTSASVSAKIDRRGLSVMIDDMVNSSMRQGRYTQSMTAAQSKAAGMTYL